MVKVAPSVLSADFAYLKQEIDSITEAGASMIHYDVMDGHFVPNISFGYSILGNIHKVTDLFLDVHLMISDPAYYIPEFIKNGADLIVFHLEAMPSREDTLKVIDMIHSYHVQAGLSIKPGTDLEALKPFLDVLDVILVMSVEPGFGGQKFDPIALDKIRALKDMRQGRKYEIEVDGGINEETGRLCKEAGADILVAGSYVFKAEDRKKAVESLK